MLFTVYVTRTIPVAIREMLESAGTVILWDEPWPVPREELMQRVVDADALLCTADDGIDAEVMAAAGRLRVISTISAGYDHIDLDAARARRIAVCHTPGVAEDAVADLTIALLLACARHLVDAHDLVKNREWRYWSPELLAGVDLQGKALGIIGLGNIGLQVAHRALGFGMRVLYYDARRNVDAEMRLGIQYGGLDNVLREADFVTLHVPLLPATRDLIDERRLRLMKPTTYLVNVARGPVINHDALVRALREGWIAGAGLDVYDREPLLADDPLLDLPNVVFTPHLGANTREAVDRMMRLAVEQLLQALRGHRPAHAIVFPDESGRQAA